ncbi:MAG: hypothetical protein ABR899_04115, partial [Candidatus Krumholzibacteriaceae bacterium]
MKRWIVLGIVLVVLIPVLVSANTKPFEKVGTFSAQFLKIGPSARAAGMGSAFTAVANDATSIYWNPAGMVE